MAINELDPVIKSRVVREGETKIVAEIELKSQKWNF